ncbi:MAG: hypothetical protein PHI28_16505 [Mangrovibacterium sp.]|nr:hypothetical protein [Mangrovibacterium sp.]
MMQKKKNIDIEVLLKYLESAEAGEAKDTIQRWLDGSGTKDDLYKESLKFWNGITRDLKIAGEYQEDAVLNKIHHHIKIEEGVFHRKNR